MGGWITVKGNQGSRFLQETDKPFYVAAEASDMQDGVASLTSKTVAQLKPQEIIEVLEGPVKEAGCRAVRVKAKAALDGMTGWVTVKDRDGKEFTKPGKCVYTCKVAIALTDKQKIDECEVVRKLLKGEVLTLLEGPTQDGTAGVVRIRAKAEKDGAEGWFTLKGNAGTVYAEATSTQYIISTTTALTKGFEMESAEVRALAENEEVEVLEGPREESGEATLRFRGQAGSSGVTGWITFTRKSFRPFAPAYRCLQACELSDPSSSTSEKTLRSLERGEKLVLLEGPKENGPADPLRFKVRAVKDGLIGWVTATGTDGKIYLECASTA